MIDRKQIPGFPMHIGNTVFMRGHIEVVLERAGQGLLRFKPVTLSQIQDRLVTFLQLLCDFR